MGDTIFGKLHSSCDTKWGFQFHTSLIPGRHFPFSTHWRKSLGKLCSHLHKVMF